MADRRPPHTDDALARRLRDLSGALDYPATPEIVTGVRRRITASRGIPHPRPMAVRRAWQRALAFALVILLLLGAALGAFPATRRAIAGRLGLRNVVIVVTVVPTPTPAPAPTPLPTSGLERELGTPTPLADAQRQVSFPIRAPTAPGYGAPDAVYVGTPPPGGRVALVYRARPGLPAIADTDIGVLLTEFRGGLNAGLFTKGVPSAAGIEAVQVRDAPGYWIAGGIRLFLYKDASGAVVQDTIRTAGNTLLWERDGVVYRMETTLPKDDALRIAASVP